jgi:peptidoglycan/LPS O-acetylase OafA/YrhL
MELLKLYILNSSGGSWEQAEAPFSHEYSVPSLISNIFLLQSLGLHDELTWNYPSWSISVEFYPYLIFIAVTLLFKVDQKVKLSIALLSLLMVYWLAGDIDNATFEYGIFRCIAGFFVGLLVYHFYEAYSKVRLPFASAIEVLLIALVSLFVIYFGTGTVSLIAPFLFALMVYIFALEQGVLSKLLKTPVLQKLGQWSYSIYMIHAFVILIMTRAVLLIESKLGYTFSLSADDLNNPLGTDVLYYKNLIFMDGVTLVYLLVVIVSASITYNLVEKKGVVLFKNIEKKLFTND